MTSVNMHEAKTHFSKLVARAAAGEEIIIARAGKPLAKLVALTAVKDPRVFGGMEGQIRMADDFDAPLPDDLLRRFEGEESDGPAAGHERAGLGPDQ